MHGEPGKMSGSVPPLEKRRAPTQWMQDIPTACTSMGHTIRRSDQKTRIIKRIFFLLSFKMDDINKNVADSKAMVRILASNRRRCALLH
jgi:hypothetical protein